MSKMEPIDMLNKRAIEAGILGPILDALSVEFDKERVLAVAGETIKAMARQQGAKLAQNTERNTLCEFAAVLEQWKKGDALVLEMLEQDEEKLSFNVKRCRYAELYHEMGVSHLGMILSCNRDYALAEGFNPAIVLERTQTIMEGAPHCDFRFHMKPSQR